MSRLGAFDMFTVTVDQPFTGSSGLPYAGNFTVLGGPDGDAQNVLGQATFAVVATPEPGTLSLVGLGMIGMGYLRRRLKK